MVACVPFASSSSSSSCLLLRKPFLFGTWIAPPSSSSSLKGSLPVKIRYYLSLKSNNINLETLHLPPSNHRRASSVINMAMEAAVEERNPSSQVILKAPSDKYDYELVYLPNGLCALLIHDPEMASRDKLKKDGSNKEEGDEEDEEEEDDEEEDDEEEDEDEDGSYEEDGDDEDDEDEDEEEDWSSEEDEENNSPTSKDGPIDKEGRKKSAASDQQPSKKMAAAAMSVGVGSFSDPKEAQGLAHFLEHMLFMGSSTFPNENEYDEFLSKHGGSSNAFTDTERTCYYFEVNHKFLRPALDRFSQFFTSPLIKADAMEREVQAVDSEFEEHLQSDSVRLSQLQCNTADKLHPFNTFSWGNRKSLIEPIAKGVDMRDCLLKLYQDHYLAGRMKLAILGGEPLETMKEWVVDLFSGIRAGGQNKLEFPWEGSVWETGKFYKMKSVKDQHYLAVTWPLPCLDHMYLHKPQDYISHLIGHEGSGSLLSLLKMKGWATELSAGCGEGGFERCSFSYFFKVTIHLTDMGLEKVEEVISLMYQYINMLQKSGPQEWVYDELRAMADMEFRFAEEEHPDDYVVTLATNMHLYPDEHIIYGEYAIEKWDPNMIANLLECLSPKSMRLDLVTKSFDENAPDVLREPWFDAPYTVESISSSLLQLWCDPPYVDPKLHMPMRNEFIPRDFSIHECGEEVATIPQILLDDTLLKVWYKVDRYFKMPRANAYFSITCDQAYSSLKDVVLTEVYVKLVRDALNETLYLANIARLETSLVITSNRFEVKLHGFNDKLSVLASKIANLLRQFNPSLERFLVMKEELEREYKNTNMKPSKHATYLRLQILKKEFWHVDDKLLALASLSLEDVKLHIVELFSKIHIEALCHGNLSREEALSICYIFRDCLLWNPLPNALLPKHSILRLPLGVGLVYKENAKNKSEENSVVEMYFQLDPDMGKETVRATAICDLMEAIIYEPCFNQLRTKEQLGYTVGCSARMTYRVLGFCFRVQSSKYTASYVEKRINDFIHSLRPVLENMSEEEIQSYKEALIAEKMEPDRSLVEETDRYWTQIVDRRFMFDINELEAAELRSMCKEDILKWYDTFLKDGASQLRKLTVCVEGYNAATEKENNASNENSFNDIAQFKVNSLFLSPLC